MRRLLFFIVGILGGLTAAVALARVLIPSRGDETSDELALVAIAKSLTLRSRAGVLTGGSLSAWMAGVDLDLARATLAADGGRLELTAVASGVDIRVNPAWRVQVSQRGKAHDLALELDGQDDLPPDAPLFRVSALMVGAGVVISNRPDDDDIG